MELDDGLHQSYNPPMPACPVDANAQCQQHRRTHAIVYSIHNASYTKERPKHTIKFFYNSSFSAKSWQDPASIDIKWSAPIECQCWQDPEMIWQKMTNYRKTRLRIFVNVFTCEKINYNCKLEIERNWTESYSWLTTKYMVSFIISKCTILLFKIRCLIMKSNCPEDKQLRNLFDCKQVYFSASGNCDGTCGFRGWRGTTPDVWRCRRVWGTSPDVTTYFTVKIQLKIRTSRNYLASE